MKRWTDAEKETLRRLYARGLRGPHKSLPGRSSAAIRTMAHALGIAEERRPWSPLEDALLRSGVRPEGREVGACWARSNTLRDGDSSPLWGNWHGNAEELRGPWSEEEEAELEAGRVPPGRSWCQASNHVQSKRQR